MRKTFSPSSATSPGVLGLLVLGLLILMPCDSRAQTTVFLVRHAEKVTETTDRDPDLTDAGRARAQELLRVVEEAGVDAVLSTPFRRTLQTARPVADHFGLEPVITPPNSTMIGDIAALVRENYRGMTVLVVGHSNTIPAIVNELAGSTYAQLEETEYDDLFVVTLSAGGGTEVRLKYGVATP